jgi:predicted Zn-dependent protease
MILRPARLRAVLTALLAGLLAGGCATVLETGRRQLMLVGSADELALGEQEFVKLKAATPIVRGSAPAALVERVGRRVAAVAPLPNARWEFVLFDKPDVMNAFCLPGGKVGVYSGILAVTANEAGLATVVAHEVAHAAAHHGAERISQALLVQLGGEVLSAALKSRPEQTRAIWEQAYGVGTDVAVMLPHSRSQELEADHLGLLYMARAGYDPAEAVAFWKRFKALKDKSGQQPPVFLSTHPLDDQRIAQIEKLLPRARAEYRPPK